MVALGVERNSLKGSFAVNDTEVEGLRVTVCAKSDFVGLFKIHFEQQKASFEKDTAASETR